MPKRLLQTRNKLTINKDRVSRKNFRDKEHIVISGVTHMIGDAVMNGILYLNKETVILCNSLNNRRIVMPSSHPTGDNGEFISASDPLALMSNFVGAFAFNFSMKDDLLISDVAIDPEVAKREKTGEQIINAIENGEPIDISTGFFLNIEESKGFGNDGEPFDFIASDLILDHVAFLPNETGAKNKFEGVGIHVNSAVDANGNKLDTDVVDLFNNESSPAMQLPLAPNDFVWNESEALSRIKAFTNSTKKPSANFRKFFLNFDQSNVDSFDSYTNLFADIIDGVPHAVKSPLESAANNKSAQAYNERFDSQKNGTNNSIAKIWNVIKSVFKSNRDLSHDELDDKIHKKLNEGRTGDQRHLWPFKTFDTKFVYRTDSDTMLMQSFALVDNEVVFIGQPIEVEHVEDFIPVTNNNGDRIMREKILTALNAANVKTEGLDDDALLAAYNKLGENQGGGNDQSQNNDGLTLEDVTTAINAAVKLAVDPLNEKLDANASKELDALVEQVEKLDIGINKEAAKLMGVNSCKDILAKNGHASFNTGSGYIQNDNNSDSLMDLEMPMQKENS